MCVGVQTCRMEFNATWLLAEFRLAEYDKCNKPIYSQIMPITFIFYVSYFHKLRDWLYDYAINLK